MNIKPTFTRFLSVLAFLTIHSFCLHSQTLTSSNLPIVIIQTNGQNIPDEPKITASMKIIWNGPGATNLVTDIPNAYDGAIGIEIRGASSAWYPQTPYAIETRDANGNDQDVSVLGFPEEHDWCLLSHYNEKTFARFPLAFEMFREMDHWAPRAQLVEVLLNGEYRGIFLFCEKIKRDNDRVNIKKSEVEPAPGSDELTGGYIFKIDYWNNGNSFPAAMEVPGFPGFIPHYVYYYPKPEDLSTLQRNYLQHFVQAFETVLYGPNFTDSINGYRKYIDVPSFIDYFIVSEVSRNNDGYKKSRYFYKDRNSEDPKIHAGPVWDFDWAWKNIDECSIFANTNGSGWAYQINSCSPDVISPGWYDRLLQDSAFAHALCARYVELRQTVLSNDRLLSKVDSIATLVSTAKTRHYTRWPILSENGWAPEVNFTPTNYAGEISRLKIWIKQRMIWLDAHFPQWCDTVDTTLSPQNATILFPNPVTDLFQLTGISRYETITCFNVSGRLVPLSGTFSEGAGWQFNTQNLPNGIYLLRHKGYQKTGVLRFLVSR